MSTSTSTSVTPPPPPGGLSLGAKITGIGAAAGGLITVGGVLALVDARSLTKLFAVALLVLLGCNLWRIGIQIWLGRYLYWRPGRIPDDKEAQRRRWINWHVAADLLVTALGIAGALALFALPEAPLLSKLVGEALLGGALYGIAAFEAGWVEETTDLESGTELVKQTRIGEYIHKRAKKEFVEGEPSFPPAKQLYLVLTRVDRADRTSATVIALTVAVGIVIPVTDVCAHAGRAFSDRLQPSPDRGTGDGVNTAPAQSAASSGRPPHHPAEGCVTHIDVGRGAPQLQRGDLNDLWNRAGDGYGWHQAGCPIGPARPVEGRTGVWYQEGFCGGELRGLGVAGVGREPGVLFQQAARFGREQVEAKRLLGAYRRRDMGNGDLSVVDVALADGSVGSYVLIRSRKSLGPSRDRADATACGAPSDTNAPYAVVPPGMLPLWRHLVERRGWAWPERDDARGGALAFVDELSARPVARGRCATETRCSLSFAGEAYETDRLAGAMATTPAELSSLRVATAAIAD